MSLRPRHRLGLALATALLAGAAVAIASTGSLTYEGCFANDGIADCREPPHNSFGNNDGIAISPDGSSVYVVAFEGTVTRLQRQPNGTLAYKGCFADAGGHDCKDIRHDSLDSATGIAVSPGGASVYVTSGQHTNAVTRFKRDATGRLRYRGCIANGGAHAGLRGCENPRRNSLDSNEAVAVSPDGRDVYVASSDSDSITRFKRTANGGLVYRGCIANRGAHGCVKAKHDSLGGAFDVAVSPGGTSVYVASLDGDAVTRFDRHSDGSLAYEDCIANARGHGCRKPDHDSLGGADAVAVSPDGTSVYVASLRADAITRFKRSPGGRLESGGCFAGGGAHGCRKPQQNSLHAANGIAISPDGKSLYVSAMIGPTVNGGPGAVTRFDRHSDGSLGFGGCFADAGRYGCNDPRLDSLGSPESIAVGPNGGSVYVGSFGRTFSIFERERGSP